MTTSPSTTTLGEPGSQRRERTREKDESHQRRFCDKTLSTGSSRIYGNFFSQKLFFSFFCACNPAKHFNRSMAKSSRFSSPFRASSSSLSMCLITNLPPHSLNTQVKLCLPFSSLSLHQSDKLVGSKGSAVPLMKNALFSEAAAAAAKWWLAGRNSKIALVCASVCDEI